MGPTSVEGVYDEIITSHGVLEILLKEKNNYDAFIIACFSDHPVIQAGREAIAKPVIGIFEAACMVACLRLRLAGYHFWRMLFVVLD